MYILALETTGPHASVAMIDQEGTLLEKASNDVFNHLQYLMPMTEALLKEADLTVQDITAVAASRGPGSFTGIRIGVSSARALAQNLGIPTISVPTLEAFAYNMPDYQGYICPILDARRNQVYAGAYQWQEGKIVEKIPGKPYSIEEFTAQVSGSAMFFGDGTEPYAAQIQKWDVAPSNVRLQSAGSVARAALELYNAGSMLHYEQLKPDYMRKAEAERRLEERQHE